MKLPLSCGKIPASSKRQARVLFAIANDAVVTDTDIVGVWPAFVELPEEATYALSEPSAYSNDIRFIICQYGVFQFAQGQEIENVLVREGRKLVVTDGYYVGVLHKGTISFLSKKQDLREYARKSCDELRHKLSAYEAVNLFDSLHQEQIDRFLAQIRPGYENLPESDVVPSSDWHWNDRDA